MNVFVHIEHLLTVYDTHCAKWAQQGDHHIRITSWIKNAHVLFILLYILRFSFLLSNTTRENIANEYSNKLWRIYMKTFWLRLLKKKESFVLPNTRLQVAKHFVNFEFANVQLGAPLEAPRLCISVRALRIACRHLIIYMYYYS